MIKLRNRWTVAGDCEPAPPVRELTAAELDRVSGGVLPAIVVVVIVVAAVVQKAENASSDGNESDSDGGEG